MNIYEVTGTLRGFLHPSSKWVVSSQKNLKEFTDFFGECVPEYHIEVYQFPLPEMYILNFIEL